MVTDRQFRRLMRLMKTEQTLAAAAAKASMDEKTARKYRDAGRLPSELARPHDWRTRADAFEAVWPQVRAHLEVNHGLQTKTLFDPPSARPMADGAGSSANISGDSRMVSCARCSGGSRPGAPWKGRPAR